MLNTLQNVFEITQTSVKSSAQIFLKINKVQNSSNSNSNAHWPIYVFNSAVNTKLPAIARHTLLGRLLLGLFDNFQAELSSEGTISQMFF